MDRQYVHLLDVSLVSSCLGGEIQVELMVIRNPQSAIRNPLISVVVLCWNGREHLEVCLSSLRMQTFREFEVVAVDNGSVDGSPEFVSRAFPEVCLIRLPSNRGFSGGNNVGIRAARGKYIALLNQDTEADPRWLEELYRGMLSDREAGSCASKMLRFDQRDTIDRAGDAYTIAGAAMLIGSNRKDEGPFNEPKRIFGACAGAALYRRSMLDEVGLFDEDFFCICEDVDLSFRALLNGYRCLYVPAAIVYHKVSSSIGLYSDFYVYHTHRNLEYVLMKDMPSSLLFAYLPLHVSYDLLSFLFYMAKGRGWTFLKAKLSALRYVPRMLRKRRMIQRGRSVSVGYVNTMLERRWLAGRARRAYGVWRMAYGVWRLFTFYF